MLLAGIVYFGTGLSVTKALEAGEGAQLLSVTAAIVFLLVIPVGFGYLSLWVTAAARMW